MNKELELNKFAEKILIANPGCLLSGSLALKNQGFKVRKEPKDIDIFLPYGKTFNKLPLIMHEEDITFEDDYDDEFYTRQKYSIIEGDIKIDVDVFTPIESSDYNLKASPDSDIIVDSVDILKMKFAHSFGDSSSKLKHQKDIIHMLVNAD